MSRNIPRIRRRLLARRRAARSGLISGRRDERQGRRLYLTGKIQAGDGRRVIIARQKIEPGMPAVGPATEPPEGFPEWSIRERQESGVEVIGRVKRMPQTIGLPS